MTVDLAIVPGVVILALELLALAAVGYLVARVALRQSDRLLALTQGLAIGMALWGLIANFVLHAVPGRAGAVLTWVLLLAFSIWIGWRRHKALPVDRSTAAGLLAVALGVFAVALAARQTLIISDAFIRLGLAAPIQAGIWPPILPWTPWKPVPYHYGTDMLVALLAPPAGPNLAFTKELLDTAAWTSLALLVGAIVRQRGGWLSLFLLTPLLLSAGAWIQLQGTSPPLLQFPAPTGLPGPGFRASLFSTYWPDVVWPWPFPEPHAAPPNTWFLRFTLAYALALTVLERLTSYREPIAVWTTLTLAALVGFLGLVEEALALTVLGLWVCIETVRFARDRPNRARILACTAAGVGTAGLLLALGGGVITGMLADRTGDSTALALAPDAARLRPTAITEARPGGLALVGVGPVILATAALVLMVRERLVIALAAGAGVFLFVTLVLEYQSAPQNVARLDAHAGNFALFGFLVAAAARLRIVKPRWRYAAWALLGAAVVWPSIVLPVRTLAFQVGQGIDLANAEPAPIRPSAALYAAGIGRQTIERLSPSQAPHYLPVPPPPLHTRPIGVLADDQVITYIRERTPADARIFSPHPSELTLATGRPNAAGFAGYLHYVERVGPEYQDAYRFLEPAAIRRLGFGYLHATDTWFGGLPDRARAWLNDPRLFDPLVRDGEHAFYRIQPEFLRMNPTPSPQSYEALQQAVPSTAVVHLTDGLQRFDKLRLASVLAHTRLSGTLETSRLHLRPGIPIDSSGTLRPDVVIVARDLALDLVDHGYPPVWWDANSIAYATDPFVAAPIDPPAAAAPDVSVRLSEIRREASQVTFAATFTDHAPQKWTGQDWLVIQVDDTPWAWPLQYEDDGYTLVGRQWYSGQVGPSGRTETYRYRLDPQAGTMTVEDAAGDFTTVEASAESLTPGSWVLVARLRQDYLQAAVIPVLRLEVSDSKQVAYTALAGERGAVLNPCPERMLQTDACRNLAARDAAGFLK